MFLNLIDSTFNLANNKKIYIKQNFLNYKYKILNK